MNSSQECLGWAEAGSHNASHQIDREEYEDETYAAESHEEMSDSAESYGEIADGPRGKLTDVQLMRTLSRRFTSQSKHSQAGQTKNSQRGQSNQSQGGQGNEEMAEINALLEKMFGEARRQRSEEER